MLSSLLSSLLPLALGLGRREPELPFIPLLLELTLRLVPQRVGTGVVRLAAKLAILIIISIIVIGRPIVFL